MSRGSRNPDAGGVAAGAVAGPVGTGSGSGPSAAAADLAQGRERPLGSPAQLPSRSTPTEKDDTMPTAIVGPLPRPSDDTPHDVEPRLLPVEPDEGLVPAGMPDDAERERLLNFKT